MGRKKRSEGYEILYMTEQRKNVWFTRMQRLSACSIGWEGLPDTIDKVYLEMCLTRSGRAIIVYDEITDSFLNGADASTGLLDVYAYPMQRSCIFRNGTQIWVEPENSVIIYNNMLRTGDWWIYELIADDMANIDMAVRTNINTQKTMPLIPISEEQLLTGKNIINAIDQNRPWQFVDANSINIDAFKSALLFDNRKSFTGDNLIAVQRELWNRALTIIGINNVNVEKRERVNTFETNSNLDEIATMRRDRLNSREEACKMMKAKWGWDVQAYYYSDLRPMEEGDGNGSIYNGTAGMFGGYMGRNNRETQV